MRMVSVELGGVAAVFKSLQNYAIFEEIVTFAYVKPFPMTDKERIDWLRNELTRHNYNYYVKNAPEITDQEFDGLMHELLALEAAHPEWDDDTSPSRRVGSDLNHEFTQVAHRYPMLSLDNTYNRDEVGAFYQRVSAGLGGEPFSLCCELKFDGLSISLTYEEGRLVRAVTRGDGVRGDDVTENVRTIRTVPLILPPGGAWPASFEMRGEVLMPWESFSTGNARPAKSLFLPTRATPRRALSKARIPPSSPGVAWTLTFITCWATCCPRTAIMKMSAPPRRGASASLMPCAASGRLTRFTPSSTTGTRSAGACPWPPTA